MNTDDLYRIVHSRLHEQLFAEGRVTSVAPLAKKTTAAMLSKSEQVSISPDALIELVADAYTQGWSDRQLNLDLVRLGELPAPDAEGSD